MAFVADIVTGFWSDFYTETDPHLSHKFHAQVNVVVGLLPDRLKFSTNLAFKAHNLKQMWSM